MTASSGNQQDAAPSTAPDAPLPPHPRLAPVALDTALALVVAGLTWISVQLDRGCDVCEPLSGLVAALIVAQTLPLALRRRAPVPVWLTVGIVTAVHGASTLDDPPLFFGALVGLYTVAGHSSRRTSIAAAAVSSVAILASVLASGDAPLVQVALNFVVFGTAWILGDSVRVRRAYTAEIEARAARLERQREEAVRQASADERARVARELHDIVAHHVGVIALQSEAARVLLPEHPERAVEVVGTIGTNARQAMVEMRRLLGALRDHDHDGVGASETDGGGGERSTSPQPGLGDLDLLVESLGDAGLAVDLVVEGEARALPQGVGLTAYRIVQEALTNVLKHAGVSRAEVVLRYGPDDVGVTISDDGHSAGRPSGGSPDGASEFVGHGLVGMRERVALFGGELWVGDHPQGGFRVEARLPLQGSSS